LAVPRARVVHKNPAHEPRGHAQELGAIAPVGAVLFHQAQIGLVHQGRGLKRVPDTLRLQVVARHAAQFPVYQRDQPLEGVLVAALQLVEQKSHFAGGICDAGLHHIVYFTTLISQYEKISTV